MTDQLVQQPAVTISLSPDGDPFTSRISGVSGDGKPWFDIPYITHVQGNLYQGGCTTGLILPPQIQHVISLYPWEQYLMRHEPASVSFHRLYDAAGEPPAIVESIAAWGAACLKDGPTLIHCQAGLNRSSLIAALALIRMGYQPAGAIALLRERRSPAVLFNISFERWLLTQP